MEQTRLAQFGSIDQTTDPSIFIRFLDAACAEGSFQTYKRRMNELLGLPGAVRLLDVGCGTGDDARQMAEVGGRVVGVDNSQIMIAEARQRTAGKELRVEFKLADALALPFAADSFDGCRADRSLMHVPDPRRALAEMLRVTRPGGRVVVYEVDFETVVIDTPHKGPARAVARAWCDSVRDGWLGRRLPGLLSELGLHEVAAWPHTLVLPPALAVPLLGAATVERAVRQGALTATEGQTWLEHLDELQRSGRFFSTMTGFLAAGRK